jgi:hypothetical protein
MSLELTDKQQQALDAEAEVPPRMIDPRTNASYFLVSAADYEIMRELLEDERKQRAIRSVGLHNAAGRMIESP